MSYTHEKLAGQTGLEPAFSGVTGRCLGHFDLCPVIDQAFKELFVDVHLTCSHPQRGNEKTLRINAESRAPFRWPGFPTARFRSMEQLQVGHLPRIATDHGDEIRTGGGRTDSGRGGACRVIVRIVKWKVSEHWFHRLGTRRAFEPPDLESLYPSPRGCQLLR